MTVVHIEYNGVGFDTSQPRKTSSRGVNLVNERLELLKETEGPSTVFEMISAPGKGTKVVLRFTEELE